MKFLRTLALLFLCGAAQAQMVSAGPEGGGELTIDGIAYRFEPAGLSSAAPKGGLPGAVKLEGKLVPKDRTRSFRLTLTVLKDGTLYLLSISRKGPGSYPDSWAATTKTRARILKLEEHPGGRVEIRCEGPLAGVIHQQARNAPWSGTLWAVFPEPGDELDQD